MPMSEQTIELQLGPFKQPCIVRFYHDEGAIEEINELLLEETETDISGLLCDDDFKQHIALELEHAKYND